ncbi:hypothetical protein ACTXQV_61860, partial [Klebsiella pneumoniae]
HHASKDDNPQTFARYGFYRFFYHIETVSKKWIKTNITSCFKIKNKLSLSFSKNIQFFDLKY